MKKSVFIGIIISICSANLSVAQSNQYPTSGDVTIRSYSPLLILQRNTNDGGFISGIQTKLSNGDDNWYFGNVHADHWMVSKGNFEKAKLVVHSNGNVGIGIVNPKNKLDVDGTIHSKEVKVDMNGWSDFVFKKDYDLPTLTEVEKHINEKGHLKDIPSEEEVLKDGINVGEMNSKLLQKIEELTLYVIEMKKEIIALKNKNQ